MSDIWPDIIRRLNALDKKTEFLASLERGIEYVSTSTSTPPTNAELDSAFGTPAATGRYSNGFVGVLYNTSGFNPSYIVWIANTTWYYAQGTLAA